MPLFPEYGDRREPEESTLNSILRFIGRPGYAVRNALDGNFEGAGRQGADFFGDIIDASLPWDVIPEFSRKQDYTEASDLIDYEGDGWDKFAIDLLGGVATDPLTYVSFGAAPVVKAAGKGLQVAANLSDDVARTGAMATELGSHLSKAGRGALKETPDLLDNIVAQGGGDVDNILSLLDDADNAALFNQGGVRMRVPFTDIGTKAIGEGHALDPLTGMGNILSKIPGSDKAASWARETFGMPNTSAAGRGIIGEADAAMRNTQKAGSDFLQQNLSGFSEPARQVMVKALHGIADSDEGWRAIDESIPAFENYADQVARLNRRLDSFADVIDPEEMTRLRAAGEELVGHNMRDFKTAVEGGGLAKPQLYTDADGIQYTLDDIAEQGLDQSQLNLMDVPDDMAPSLYLHRIIDKLDDTGKEFVEQSNASGVAHRKLKSPEALADFLNSGKGQLKLDLAESVASRARQQGTLMGKASIGRQILGDSYVHVDDASREVLDETLEGISKVDPDFVKQISTAMNGIPERGWGFKVLDKTNKYFKPFAVYGAVIPKMGSIIRNKLGQAWQAGSTDATRGGALQQLKNAPADIGDAISEAYGDIFNLPRSEMGRARQTIDAAFSASNGQLDDAMRILEQSDPRLALAAQHGILDGFVKSEDLVKQINKIDTPSKLKQNWNTFFYGPGVMFNAVESNGRLAMFLKLLDDGTPPANAAQHVTDAFLDYSITSANNRGLRDLIPFASFMTGTVKQQSQLLSRNPGVGTALNQVFGQDDEEPIYPWLSEQAHMRLPWDDESGNPTYAAGLGLPIEALNNLPNPTGGNFGEDFKRSVIGSSHPLLKSAYSWISGKDPYFDSDYGSYGKDPLTHQDSDFGRIYNVAAGTGMIQPIDSSLRMIGKFTDPDDSLGTSLLDALTGVKVINVDQDRARKQMLRELLESEGGVGQFTGYYSDDPEMKELIKLFQRL